MSFFTCSISVSPQGLLRDSREVAGTGAASEICS